MQVLLVKARQHKPQRITCSLNDYFAFRAPASVVFFYRTLIPYQVIVSALEHVLQDFPIFAGILVKDKQRMYIDCNNQGVQIHIATSNDFLLPKLNNLTELDTRFFIDSMNPHRVLKQGLPVFNIKLNYYQDGMAIGYCWHHSLGDMATLMTFLNALSAFAQGKNYRSALIVEDREKYFKERLKKRTGFSENSSQSSLTRLSFIDKLRFLKQLCLPKKHIYLHFTEKEINNLRNRLSNQLKRTLSYNDVISAHVLHLLSQCRTDKALMHHLSIIINIRPYLKMPSSISGNYLDMISIKYPKSEKIHALVNTINLSVKNYLNEKECNVTTERFIQKNGGINKLENIIPEILLPQNKNLMISNLSNFKVYSIDFGISKPCLFLPAGKAPLPWVSCIVKGFDNKGLLVGMVLPLNIAKRLAYLSKTQCP